MPIHSIDAASGAVAFDKPDIGLPGVLPLSFVRHYSTSNLLRDAELGPGWSHNFDHRLLKTIEGWQYVDERGTQTQIVGRFHGGIELVEKDERTVWLRRYTSGNPRLWLVFRRHDDAYLLREIRLTDRQRLRVHRKAGRIETVEHVRSGRRLCFEYLDEVDTADHPRALGRLACVSLSFPGSPQWEPVMTYLYDADARLAEVVGPGGTRTAFEYDEWGCVTRELKPGGSDYAFEYDTRCRCIHARGTDGFEERWLSYDDARRTTTVTDRHGNATTYVSNAAGQIVLERLPNGAQTRRAYDEHGNLASSTGPLGNTVLRRYDEHNRLCEIHDPSRKRTWELQYDDGHRLLSVKVPTGHVWRYEYDQRGFLSSTLGPEGYAWRYEYTEAAELCAVVDPHGHLATRTYDQKGDVVQTEAAGRRRAIEYDAWSRPISVRDADGTTTTRVYDTCGRLVRIETTAGLRLDYKYDEAGRVVERTGPGGTYRAAWMGCGCLREAVRPDGSTVTLRWGDEPGHLRELVDPQGKVIAWEYDAVGRPIRRRHYNGTEISIDYDLAGNPVRIEDSDGRVFECTFDPDNNLLSYTSPSGDTTTYAYDVLDRLVRAQRGDTELSFGRDPYGAVVQEITSAEWGSTVLRRARDGLGRPTRVRVGDLEATAWTYGGPYVTAVEHGENEWEIGYDALGRPSGRTLQSSTLLQQHDAAGRVVRQAVEASTTSFEYVYRDHAMEILGPETRQAFEVGELDRLATWRWEPSSGHKLHLQREHDPAGNFLRESLDVDGRSTRHDNDVRHNRVERVWDPYRDHVVFYEYDAQGRVVLRRGPELTTFEWTDDGWLAAAVVDGERWTYDYDPFGRRIRKTAPDGRAWFYFWDDGRIAGIETHEGERIEYVYLAQGASPIAFRTQGRTWDLLSRPDGTPVCAVNERGRATPLRAHLDPWGRPFAEVATKPRMGFPNQEGFVGSPGQIFDPETGLYYNVHRYYDPLLSAFLTPDPCGLLGGLNEYAWVQNPMVWIDPLGLRYVSGGPMPWSPNGVPRDPAGRPNLSDPNNRFVDVVKPDGNTRQYTVKDRGENHNGKCLAVADGVPDSALPTDRGFSPGDSPAFVSGQGFPDAAPVPDFGVRTDQMGNWCHAEIQGLWFLAQNDISGATLWVDRPPCPMCAADLDGILDAHFPGGDGRSVTVMYLDPDEGWMTWDEYKSRKNPPCGG